MTEAQQRALQQAEAIARLAHLRLYAQPALTDQGHLRLDWQQGVDGRACFAELVGQKCAHLVYFLRWEARHQSHSL